MFEEPYPRRNLLFRIKGKFESSALRKVELCFKLAVGFASSVST